MSGLESNLLTHLTLNGSGAVGRMIFPRMGDSSNIERFFVEWTVCRKLFVEKPFVDSFLVEKSFVEIYQSSSIYYLLPHNLYKSCPNIICPFIDLKTKSLVALQVGLGMGGVTVVNTN